MMPLIRERDTAEATALLSQVQERGSIPLPQLTGICSVPGQLRVGDLRLFGFFDQVHADAFVLLERSTARGLGTFGRIREYVLATVDAAAGLSADWIRASFETDQEAGDKPRL